MWVEKLIVDRKSDFIRRVDFFEYSVEQNVEEEVVSMRGRGVEIWEMGGRSRWMSWEVVFLTQHHVYEKFINTLCEVFFLPNIMFMAKF